MGVALGWVAFTLAGLGAAPHAERDQTHLTYTVRMVEVDGVHWREAVYTRLKPVTRQGSATVWTVPRDTTTQLLANVGKDPATKILQAPKVTAFSGVPATVQHRQSRPLVTQVTWNGAEPAHNDAPEKLRVGWHTTMIGRKLDQGVLVKVVFEDTVIRAVHRVRVNQDAERKCAAADSPPIAVPQGVGGFGLYGVAEPPRLSQAAATTRDQKTINAARCTKPEACCQEAENGHEDDDAKKAFVEVPEVDTQEVVGEWLIGRGDVLLVSFGAHTVAGEDGEAVVKERLAIIDADETPGGAGVAGLPAPMPFIHARVPVLAEPKPIMPPGGLTPIMPSRSIPQGVHADGTPAVLPPLPADETELDSSSSESSEPMASPQTKKIPAPRPTPKPATDTAANKVEFTLPKAVTMFLPSLSMPSPTAGFQFLMPIKPFSLKLPFGQKLEVEVLGRIVSDPEALNSRQ